MPHVSNSFLRRVLNVFTYLICLLMLMTMFILGPRIEAQISPVVGAFRVIDIWQDKDPDTQETRYWMSGALVKLREECQPVDFLMMSGGGFNDPTSTIIQFDTSQDPVSQPDRMISRPAGSQYWGPWRMYPPKEPIGPLVTIVVRHRCHGLWQLTQTIYTRATKDFFPGLRIDIENDPNDIKQFQYNNRVAPRP